ncbi:MAG TPA: pitrilysin family protein [Candidatus Sulfotelmatobacter sp.]|nr:pitrilysin family protein [Candidatus Sulfotelmatobacter sp.]
MTNSSFQTHAVKMKRSIAAVTLLTATAIFVPLPRALAQAASYQQVPILPLPAFHPQQPKRIELANGMVIFLQEDHELPLIDGTARIRGGSRNEPVSKTGLVDIYGEVWRTGGTKAQTGDQLDDFLEVRAAKVETGGGPDSTTIGWSCLKGDLDDVFKAFVDVLQHPEFRADKIDIAKKGEDDGISRRNDQAGGIAARESAKLAYGADNPYTREPEYATVAAITRQDLLDWHAHYVHPNNIVLGITGDFDSAAMEAKLRAAFDSWPKGPALPKDDIQYHPAPPGYYLVPKDDVNQSSIHMVALGTTRDNPDYYAISVFNEAFGGGFSSRLFNDIRTRRGLAYNVGGGIGANFGHPGILQIVMGTKSQSTIEAIQAAGEDIDNLARQPITDDEIKRAKDSILNAFIFRLDSPDKILAERMTYEYYGYPPDWLDKYEAEIRKVTAADVNQVAAKYLHRDQFSVLVVGNTKEFDKPLSSLGAVKEIDITIPPPPVVAQAGLAQKGAKEDANSKITESNAEGKALAGKLVAAMGGEAKLASIKSLKAKLTITRKTPQGDFPLQMETIIVFPDRLHAEMQTPSGIMEIVVSPDAAFMAMAGQGVRDFPASQKVESLEQIKRDPIFIASHWKDPNVFFRAGGTEKIGDVEARIVDVNAAGAAIRWYVDPQTGHILKETYRTLGQGGPVQGETDMENWKTMGGVTIPLMRKNKQDGEDSSAAEYTSLEINSTVDSKIFDKPAEKPADQP